jgi:hypothetical protein
LTAEATPPFLFLRASQPRLETSASSPLENPDSTHPNFDFEWILYVTLTANEQMWAELGIDLKSHGQLMNALGPIFGEIYLSQKNRPRRMGFYDFVVGDIHGIRVKELTEHAKAGGKVVAT